MNILDATRQSVGCGNAQTARNRSCCRTSAVGPDGSSYVPRDEGHQRRLKMYFGCMRPPIVCNAFKHLAMPWNESWLSDRRVEHVFVAFFKRAWSDL